FERDHSRKLQAGSLYDPDHFERGFAHGPHQGQARNSNQSRNAPGANREKPVAAFLTGRPIDDPEVDRAHLKEPENIGQVRFQVLRNSHAAIDYDAAKPAEVGFPDLPCLRAEGRKRIRGIRAVSQQSPQYSSVRREMSPLYANQFNQTFFQAGGVIE